MFSCPSCGHKQEEVGDGSDICSQCGLVGSKYSRVSGKKKLIELEKRRYETIQRHRQNQESQQDEQNLREKEIKEIRKQFGWEDKFKTKTALMSSISVLALVGSVAVVYALQDVKTQSVPPHSEQLASSESFELAGSGASVDSSLYSEEDLPSSKNRQAEQHVKTLNQIARKQGAGGNYEAAQQTHQKALLAADKIKDSDFRDQMVASVSQNQARIGQLDQSMETAKDIKDAKLRAEALSAIVTERSQVGDNLGSKRAFAQMMETVKQAESKEKINSTYVQEHILEYSINNEDFSQALEITAQDDNPLRRALSLTKVVDAQLRLIDIPAAKKTMALIEKSMEGVKGVSHRAKALSVLGRLHAILGSEKCSRQYFALALQSARHIEDFAERAKAYSAIAREQWAAGRKASADQTFAQAKEFAFLVSMDEVARDKALRIIADDLASIKEFAQALKIADKIKSPYLHSATLKNVAEMQLADGEINSAKQTFTRALKSSKRIDKIEERLKLLDEITEAQIAALGGL
jgi:tetratricopeptide (TPR) repeat protein